MIRLAGPLAFCAIVALFLLAIGMPGAAAVFAVVGLILFVVLV